MKSDIRLNNSELKIMNILWEREALSAKEISLEAAARHGWNKNTTYTILKGLVEKEYIRRDEPNFICTPLLAIDSVRRWETRGLIDRLFGGSPGAFLSTFFEQENLTGKELADILKIIDGEVGQK
ncbi:BlaI/MecI/CopY family transcriptional regulator [Oscillospiraceae bacterium PP1C4]